MRMALRSLSVAIVFIWSAGAVLATEAKPKVSGTFVANGKTIALPYAYVWAEKEGFYDKSDPTWTIVFVEHPIDDEEDLDFLPGTAWVKLGITRSAEFSDEPELQVYSQSVKLSADAMGNVSGGKYPKIELTSTGPDHFAGHVYHEKVQEFSDDTFQYDLTFDLLLTERESD